MKGLNHMGDQTSLLRSRILKGKVLSLPVINIQSFLLFLVFTVNVTSLAAQSAGDYRSNAATMNWSAAASWQKYDGTSWSAATDYPGQNSCSGCTVTIQNGHTVTLNVSPANSIGNLVVGGGTNGTLTLGTFTLSVAGNLTVSTGATLTLATGTFSVGGTSSIAGNVSDASNTGVVTFTGLITKTAGTWTSTSVTTASNMNFLGGITNAGGTFSAGAATVADNQTLTGNINISFNGGLTILGNGDLNVAGTTGAGVVMTGSANYTVRNLTLTGLLTVSTTGNLTVTGNTSLTGTGAFIDNNNAGITSFAGTVTHNSSGSWVSTTVSTASNMVFTSGFTNTAGSFSAGAATIGDNQTLTGTVNMTFNAGVSVLGNADLNIAGTTTTGVSFGGSANYTVRNLNLTGRLTASTSGNLNVTGTTSITGSGSFVDNNNTGITTFTGTITHNSTGTFTTTTVTTPGNMVFNAGITNTAGTFSAGGATVAGDLTLNGTVIMTFANGLNITGSGNITIAGTGGVRLGGTANYTIPGNLTLTGTLAVSTSGNFTVTGTTSITGAGDFTDSNNGGISTFTGSVIHNSTGRWVSTTVTTAANLVFMSGFTNTAGSFSAAAATIGDNQTLTGTVNMTFSRGITVLGNGDITIAGTTTSGVSFGGTAINYTVRNLVVSGLLTVSTTGNFTVTGTTDITGTGAFLDNQGTGITSFAGLVTVGSNATFTATVVTTIGRLTFGGGIVHNNTTASTFYVGSIRTTATQTWSGNGGITSTGVLDINAGTLTNNMAGAVSAGGTLTGTAFVQGTNAYLYLGSTTPVSITTLTATANGNTVEYRSTGSATIRSQTYHHLIISGTGTKTLSNADATINGNLTINSGVLGNTTNNRNITLYGNWINNVATGGFTAGTGTVTFAGSAVQTLGGTGATTFYRLTINNAAGVTQTSSSTVTNVLTFTSGNITTGSTSVIISSTGSVSRTSGHINGNEQRNFATGANVARTFDIGDASSYTPVTITFASVSVAGNVTVKSTGTEHPFIVSAYLNSTLSINRYWTISNSTTVFTNYSAVFNFVAGDKDASVNTANVIAGRYSASTWSYPTVGTKTSTSTQVTGLTAFGDIAIAEQLPCSTPTVVITDPSPFCSPATVDLTAASITAGSTSGLTYTYWTDASATISLSSPAAVSVAGTYYIKGTVALGGCSDVKPVVVTRNNPTGVISGTTTICAGSSATLSIAVTGTGPWSGTLSDGSTFSGSGSPLTVNVSPVANTTYSISTLTDAACTAQSVDKTGTAVVSIAALPTAANAGPDQSVCASSVTLAANTPSVGTGSWSIVSGSGGSFSSVTDPAATFTGSVGVTYTLRWSTTNSPCTVSTDDVVIAFTSGVWTGTVSSDWNNSANWCGGFLPVGIIDLTLPAGLPNYPAIDGNVIINNLSVSSGASISVTSNGALIIRGSYSNSGSIDNDGSVVLNGTTQQSFPGASATVIKMKNLEVDNDAGALIDKSFSITGTLIPTSGVIVMSDKKITLVSNSSGTARVAPVGGSFDYTGGGKFVVERYVPARRAWRLITSPLTGTNSIFDSWQNGGVYTPGKGTFITGPGGANGLDADAGSSLKQWDVSSQSLVQVLNTTTAVSPGVSGASDNAPYFLFVRGDRNPANLTAPNTNATVLSSEGQLQTGNQSFTATSVAGGFTLIGNPYASPIDFNTLTRSNLVKRFYAWDPSLNTVGGYVTLDDVDNDGVFSNSVSGSIQTSEILSHQAFFVETAAAGAAGVTITENDKTDGSTYVVARPSSARRQSLSINLNLLNADGSTVLADGTKAEFDNDFDAGVNYEDALKFSNINETFSLIRNSKALALERRPVPAAADTLYFKLSKVTVRNYRLKFVPANLEDLTVQAYLKDNFTGTETPVSLTDSTLIDFSVNNTPASYSASRFMVVFKPYNTLPLLLTHVSAMQQQNGIAVNWKAEGEEVVAGYNVEKSADGRSFTTVHSAPVAAGNYQWTDEHAVKGNNFYRIKMNLNNGSVRYSSVVLVTTGKTQQQIAISPNPVTNNVIGLQLAEQQAGSYTIKLYNSLGSLAYSKGFVTTGNNASFNFNIPASLSKGNYFAEVTGPGGIHYHQQVALY